MWSLKLRDSDSKYREINNNDGEDTSLPVSEDHRHWNLLLYIVISILATGWTTTTILYWKSSAIAPTFNGKFQLGTFTPIPEDVFKPVRKVFQPDERYIGNSREVDHHWDDLVAGKNKPSQSKFIVYSHPPLIGHDAVWIEDPDRWSLPEGIVAPFDHPHETDPPQHDFYVVSILHQLHCLVRLRLASSNKRLFLTQSDRTWFAFSSGRPGMVSISIPNMMRSNGICMSCIALNISDKQFRVEEI